MNRAQKRRLEMLNAKRSHVDQEVSPDKKDEFLKNREEFTIQISMLNAITGLRFAGMLRFKKEAMEPYMSLEPIPSDRLKHFRFNNKSRTKESLAAGGYKRVVIPPDPNFFQKILWIIPKFKKAFFVKYYQEAVIRFGMIYFTFVGEQNGALVAAIDTRELSEQELAGLKKINQVT